MADKKNDACCKRCGGTDHKTANSKKCAYFKPRASKKGKTTKKKTPRPIEVQDIEILKNKCQNRGNNDANNMRREDIFLKLFHCEPEFLEHPEYGKDWKTISTQAKNVIQKAFQKEGIEFHLEKVAGRHHHDFNLWFDDEPEKVYHLEYKHNANSIQDLPQILQIDSFYGDTSSRAILKHSYESFFYHELEKRFDEFKEIALDTIQGSIPKVKTEHLKPDKMDEFKLIPKKDYLKAVRNYDKKTRHPFFEQLKELKQNCRDGEYLDFVRETIQQFLQQYGKEANLERFKKLILETQEKKCFILWSCQKQEYNCEFLDIQENHTFSLQQITKNEIRIETNQGIQFNALLRWKNGNGILKPAFQIKALRKKIEVENLTTEEHKKEDA